METLFKDSETFQKERPTKLTDKQSDELFKKLSKEVIENGWSKNDAGIIAKDLSELKYCNSGYERAKELNALPISEIATRDWGHKVCYFSDPDGHIIAFAQSIE